MSGSYTGFPIANVNVPSLPDLGGVTDAGMLVGERAGTGRFAATALRDYVMTTVTAGYLPLTGGTLTGRLSLTDMLTFTSTGMTLNTTHDFSEWVMNAGNYNLLHTSISGVLEYRKGDGTSLWSVDSFGNSKVLGGLSVYGGISCLGDIAASGKGVFTGTLSTSGGSFTVDTTGNVTTGGTIAASGSIASNSIIESASDVYARGGHYFFGAADQAVLNATGAGTSLRFSADGWALSWASSTGTIAFFNNAALALLTVDAAGNGVFHGTVHGTNVTVLEAQATELQARIAGLEEDVAGLKEALTTGLEAIEALQKQVSAMAAGPG